MQNYTFQVKGMACSHCVATVENAVKSIDGVLAAKADLASGKLTVEAKTDGLAEQITAAVRKKGFDIQ